MKKSKELIIKLAEEYVEKHGMPRIKDVMIVIAYRKVEHANVINVLFVDTNGSEHMMSIHFYGNALRPRRISNRMTSGIKDILWMKQYEKDGIVTMEDAILGMFEKQKEHWGNVTINADFTNAFIFKGENKNAILEVRPEYAKKYSVIFGTKSNVFDIIEDYEDDQEVDLKHFESIDEALSKIREVLC